MVLASSPCHEHPPVGGTVLKTTWWAPPRSPSLDGLALLRHNSISRRGSAATLHGATIAHIWLVPERGTARGRPLMVNLWLGRAAAPPQFRASLVHAGSRRHPGRRVAPPRGHSSRVSPRGPLPAPPPFLAPAFLLLSSLPSPPFPPGCTVALRKPAFGWWFAPPR